MTKKTGLMLITLPIGNPDDLTLKALNALKEMRTFLCEDTRKLKDLLKRLGIAFDDKKISSFHDHSDLKKLEGLKGLLTQELVGFCSDAGNPLISDPALPLIQFALSNDICLHQASGISAPLYALGASGLAATPFHFHGFLGRKSSEIEDFCQLVESQYGTHIFFEGISRLEKTLEQMCKRLEDLDFVVGRELTKTHESFHRFKGANFSSIQNEIVYKGEVCLLVHNPHRLKTSADGKLVELAQEIYDNGAKPKAVAKLIAQILGKGPKEVYGAISRP